MPREGGELIELLDADPSTECAWRYALKLVEGKNLRRELEGTLKDLENVVGDIQGSAVIRSDGLVVAFAMPRDTDESLVAAMSAALLNIGTRTAQELDRGNLERVIVSGDKGDVVLMGAGRDCVLSATTRSGANMGLVLVEMKRTQAKLSQAL
jgi:hypothetical protein